MQVQQSETFFGFEKYQIIVFTLSLQIYAMQRINNLFHNILTSCITSC